MQRTSLENWPDYDVGILDMNIHSFELRSSDESTYMQNTYALFSLPKSYVFVKIMWIIKHD